MKQVSQCPVAMFWRGRGVLGSAIMSTGFLAVLMGIILKLGLLLFYKPINFDKYFLVTTSVWLAGLLISVIGYVVDLIKKNAYGK